MAVLLYREGERKSQAALPPEMRSLPRVTVRNQPVIAAPNWRGPLRARTPTHVCYSRPEREEVWREKFERRQVQQTECGFHGHAYHPYRDVGQVELDDPSLILGGLGQKQDGQLLLASPPPPSSSPTHNTPPPPPPRPKLRSMAPQLPDHLCLLPEEMREGDVRRGEVRVGRGLFEVLSTREKAKVTAATEKDSDSNTLNNGWQPANVTFDPSQPATRRASIQMERRMSTVTFDPITSSHDNRSRSERRGSHANLDPGCHDNVTSERRMSTVTFDGVISSSHDNQQTSNHNERPLTSGSSKVSFQPAADELEGEGGDYFHHLMSSHQWYRQLCVLVWVMDGLRLDSTAHLVPFAKCWQIDRAGVQSAHSLSLSRGRSPAKTEQNWRKIICKTNEEGFPQPNTDRNPLQDDHMTTASPAHLSSAAYRRRRREAASREEQRMRQQKRLTSLQMEALVKSVDEELNFSKKANKLRIQRLLQEPSRNKRGSPSPPPSSTGSSHHLLKLDVTRVQEQFTETEQIKTMTVHHQLSAMERDRCKALEQRLVSLRARHSLWRDLDLMRQGAEIESTCMARKKLLMNFNWYSDLLSRLPDTVKTDRYCRHLLDLLSAHSVHSAQVGPDQWSKRRLIAVLSSLRPWELHSPETAAATQFLISHVIYILPEDYEQWLESLCSSRTT